MNNIEFFQLLVRTACSDGVITEREYTHLRNKCRQYNISIEDLDFMIESELELVKNRNGQTNNQKKADKNNNTSGFSDQSSIISDKGEKSVLIKTKEKGEWKIYKRLKEPYRTNPDLAENLFKEYNLLSKLNNPHIVNVFDKGTDKAGPFYSMEYLEGRELSSLTGEYGIHSGKLVKKIAIEILETLIYCRELNLNHGHLVSENILITYHGDSVKLIDFFPNAVNHSDSEDSTDNEQLNLREHHQKSDIYFFGIILLQMLTGKKQNADYARQRIPALSAVITQCLTNSNKNELLVLSQILKSLRNIEIPDNDPVLKLETDYINFGRIRKKSQKLTSIQLENAGQGFIDWDFKYIDEAINCKKTGESELEISLSPVKKGNFESRVEIVSNAGNKSILLKAKVVPGSRTVLITILAVVLVNIIALGAFYYLWLLKRNDKLSWKKAQEIHTIEGYKDYMSEQPEGRFAQQAHDSVRALSDERIMWEQAKSVNTIESYSSYLDQYPGGRYKDLAAQMLEMLKSNRQEFKEEEFFWSFVKKMDTKILYLDYIKKFPQGEHVKDAQDSLKKY